jgi:hypothetical protein
MVKGAELSQSVSVVKQINGIVSGEKLIKTRG